MSNALGEKCCTPCRGAIPPLTLDEAQRYLAQDTPDPTREFCQHRCLVAEASADLEHHPVRPGVKRGRKPGS